jgi:hypothetical protein
MIPLMLLLAIAQPPRPAPAAASAALSDAEIRNRVAEYLRFFEAPVPESAWQALGPRAEPMLIEIANGTGLPTRRAKAVAGLVALGGQSTPALLSKLSLDEAKPLTVRLVAVRGLAHMTSDDALVDVLRPVLTEAKDERVGSTAAELIAKRVPAAGCGLVRERGANRARFSAAMATCATR